MPDSQDPLTELEQRLHSWAPTVDGLERDRMLFEAGRSAAQPARRWSAATPWQIATAASVLVAAALGFAWQQERNRSADLSLVAQNLSPIHPPPRQPQSEPVIVDRDSPVDPNSYLGLVRLLHIQTPEGEISSSRPPRFDNPRATSTPASKSMPLRARDFDRVIAL